ncbi:hypothetical protein [Sphingobium sp. CECT 9361]|uniref:hypothetical protein n=1 Tax=Sphingobium sp. CECT 9361 TaxID=2845384 RepID=UPI001E317540|nr:hypothetical protein [Sphingobium sp. CECT 9361]CAH0357207.1 hypothetical protein SPH9361_04856 [Sphingobium sp. CECT 9361]
MTPTPRLTVADAAVVKAMLSRGDRQSDIAAFFKVNAGRISEINTGKRFTAIKPANQNVPPPGPYSVN